MLQAPPKLQYEGTWEEIARRSDEFAGKRVRLTVLVEDEPAELRQAAMALMAHIDAIQPDLGRPPLTGQGAQFAEGVAAKLRNQGIGL